MHLPLDIVHCNLQQFDKTSIYDFHDSRAISTVSCFLQFPVAFLDLFFRLLIYKQSLSRQVNNKQLFLWTQSLTQRLNQLQNANYVNKYATRQNILISKQIREINPKIPYLHNFRRVWVGFFSSREKLEFTSLCLHSMNLCQTLTQRLPTHSIYTVAVLE